MKARPFWVTAGIVALGAILGAAILLAERPHHDDGHEHGSAQSHAGEKTVAKNASEKGPHGGRLLRQDDFAIEVTIHERGVPPEFRLYGFEKGEPVTPGELKAAIELERLGAPSERMGFRPLGDFLQSEREVEEPHSFKVTVAAERGGRAYRWTYEQAEGRVPMDDAMAKKAGIEVRTAGPAPIRSILQLPGEVQFNRDRMAHVAPQVSGVVVSSPRNLGDPVRKGDVLAVLQSRELATLKSEFLAARTRLSLAGASFQREKQLFEEKISARQDYEAARHALAEAEIAQRSLEQRLRALGVSDTAATDSANTLTHYEVRAPIDGELIEKRVAAGEAAKEDATIFVVADLSTVWAEVTVYPKDLALVTRGQRAVVRATGLNASAEGVVSYMGPLVGEQTRAAKARVTLQNRERVWRPGLFITVELVHEQTQVRVAVPVDAIQSVGDWKVVFARFGNVFEARPVELGRSDGRQVEIAKGLAPGTAYAASNSFLLKAELGKAGATHSH